LTAEDVDSWADAANVLKATAGYGSEYSQSFKADDEGHSTQTAGLYVAVTSQPSGLLLLGTGVAGGD